MVKKQHSKKATSRGGPREKSTPTTSQGLLIDYIWTLSGGPTRVAALCGIDPSLSFAWRFRGSVPLKYTRRVAEGLKVPLWALNYSELAEFQGKAPLWDKVVKKCRLSKQDEQKVLYLSPPEVPDDIEPK